MNNNIEMNSKDTIKIPLDFLQFNNIGCLFIDENGDLYQANEYISNELGYKRETILTKTIFEINPNVSLRKWKTYWNQLKKENVIQFNTEYITADEIIYPVAIRASRLSLNNQSYACFISKNITEIDRYKEILQLTSKVARLGNWSWDLVKNKFTVNTQIYTILEVNKQEKRISRANIFEILVQLLSKEDRAILKQKIKLALSSGLSFEQEVSFNLPNKSSKRVNITALPIMPEDQTVHVYGTVQDISNIASRSEEMYLSEFSLDQIKEMVLWVEEDASIIYANQACVQNVGYSRAEMLKMKIPDISARFDESKWQKHWQTLRKKKNTYYTYLERQPGGPYSIQVSSNLFIYKGREINCILLRDITKEVRQRKRLEYAQLTLDKAGEEILWIKEDGSFDYVNNICYQRSAYTEEDFKTLNISDIITEFTPEKWQSLWQQIKKTNHLKMDATHIRKDGESFDVSIGFNYFIFDEHEIVGTFIRDISQRKQREAKLQHIAEENEKLRDRSEKEKAYLLEEVNLQYNFDKIVTQSPRYRQVLKQVERVAQTNATVLVLGETGTGKELLARAVHHLSNRTNQTLVKINCAALPPNLIESELFGHEKGAFTGAIQRKLGRFELANKGTIFLDEIGEMPLELQPKLLRVLQEGEFQRVGGTQTVKIDVRVIAATNRNLENLVKEGKFREDLFYRLNIFPIMNLPLRERKEDIPILVKHFMKQFSEKIGRKITKVSQHDMKNLMKYEFPGNIRELENIIERAAILTRGNMLNIESVLPSNRELKQKTKNTKEFQSMEDLQRDHILEALKRTYWRVTGKNSAAELLKMNGKTLASRMKKLGIFKEDYLD